MNVRQVVEDVEESKLLKKSCIPLLKELGFYGSGIGWNHKELKGLKIYFEPYSKGWDIRLCTFNWEYDYFVGHIKEFNELKYLMSTIRFHKYTEIRL